MDLHLLDPDKLKGSFDQDRSMDSMDLIDRDRPMDSKDLIDRGRLMDLNGWDMLVHLMDLGLMDSRKLHLGTHRKIATPAFVDTASWRPAVLDRKKTAKGLDYGHSVAQNQIGFPTVLVDMAPALALVGSSKVDKGDGIACCYSVMVAYLDFAKLQTENNIRFIRRI